VGPPARAPGTTRLFLSGDGAGEVAALFLGSVLEAIVIDGGVGAASALKATYAAYTKGHAALFLAVRALARAEGVEDVLLTEWGRSQPDLGPRSEGAAATAAKGWRFVGELEEIAETFKAAGLPEGFHRAAAELYARLAEFKDARTPPTLDEVLRALSASS
jgi:hypothetical protein